MTPSRAHKEAFPVMLVYIFIFQNLLNAGSPYITLAINTSFAAHSLFANKFYIQPLDSQVTIFLSLVILAWLILVALYRGNFEAQVLLKYSRNALTIVVTYIFIASSKVNAKTIIGALSFALAFHVFLVLAQIPLPELTQITAPIFGFEREASILEQYALRKLGASSSYDTASLFSASASFLFYLRYKNSKQKRFAILFVAALAAGMMSSRTGMGLTLALLMYTYVRAIIAARPVMKFILSMGLAGVIITIYIAIYPIILHSLGIREIGSDEASFIFVATDYGTTGTLTALSDDHLTPLKQPLPDLVIGFAMDPNTMGRHSDIGYVKFIYHVGIIGTVLIVTLHLWMMANAAIGMRASNLGRYDRDLRVFLAWLIGVGLIFNYKSLEMYSRGIGDLTIIIFFFVMKLNKNQESFRKISDDPR